MALKRERHTSPAGIPDEYTIIEKIGINKTGSVVFGLQHFATMQARIDGKEPINKETLETVNIRLTEEEKATFMQICYGALKRHPEFLEAIDQDPDEWKLANQEEGAPANE